MQISGEMQKLTEKIQVLKEEQILSPEKAQVLEKDLDRIPSAEALGRDPAKTMEAIDHLEQSLSKTAAAAAETAIKQMETASRTQQLAEAMQAAQGQMDPKQFGEAMKELAHMARQAAAGIARTWTQISPRISKKRASKASGDRRATSRGLCKALKECKLSEQLLAKLIQGAAG